MAIEDTGESVAYLSHSSDMAKHVQVRRFSHYDAVQSPVQTDADYCHCEGRRFSEFARCLFRWACMTCKYQDNAGKRCHMPVSEEQICSFVAFLMRD